MGSEGSTSLFGRWRLGQMSANFENVLAHERAISRSLGGGQGWMTGRGLRFEPRCHCLGMFKWSARDWLVFSRSRPYFLLGCWALPSVRLSTLEPAG
jgi:hypothetical protein